MKYTLTEAEIDALVENIDDTDTLRSVFRNGRQLPRRFYELIAQEHAAILRIQGDAPVGEIMASCHGVTPGCISRWLKKTRELGLIA